MFKVSSFLREVDLPDVSRYPRPRTDGTSGAEGLEDGESRGEVSLIGNSRN